LIFYSKYLKYLKYKKYLKIVYIYIMLLIDKINEKLRLSNQHVPDVILNKIYQELGSFKLSASPSVTHYLEDVITLLLQEVCNRCFTLAGQLRFEIIRRQLPDTLEQIVGQLPVTAAYKQWVSDNVWSLDVMIYKGLELEQRSGNLMNHFAAMTCIHTYCLKNITTNLPGESYEHMLLREAYTVTKSKELSDVSETYYLLMQKYYTHASPTLFNSASSKKQQLSSCFLLECGDSIDAIYDTLKRGAQASKHGGGLGISLQKVRAKGSNIYGGGKSSGIAALCPQIEQMTNYVSQQGRRRGSAACFLQVWHKDIMDFAQIRLNVGDPKTTCFDLFTAVVVNDIFMTRLQEPNSYFTLFCPKDTPILIELYGPAFTDKYLEYELHADKYNGIKVKTHVIWESIMKSLIETGSPYILSKSAMQHSPQSGLIDGKPLLQSNLCSEIIQYAGDSSYGHLSSCCNLATIKLDTFVKNDENGNMSFDFEQFAYVVYHATKTLDHTIDITETPEASTARSNSLLRPLSLGVQGLSDLFMKLNIPFNSIEARKLNFQISEAMYYHAVHASIDLAKIDDPYPLYFNSRQHKENILQFDYIKGSIHKMKMYGRNLDWQGLKDQMKLHGLRNSLLIGYPPTASTSQLLGSVSESFEPLYSNLYERSLKIGNFIVFNKYLQRLLEMKGLMNKKTINQLLLDNGSVANIQQLLDPEKAVFTTAFETKQKPYIDMAADRNLFTDQSMSLNLFFAKPTKNTLTSCIMYGYKQSLKTLCYYVKRRPIIEQRKFSLGIESITTTQTTTQTVHDAQTHPQADKECLMCGS